MGILQAARVGDVPLTAGILNSLVSGACGSPGAGSCNATTGTNTIQPSGGSGSYTYSWVHDSGTAATPGLPTAAVSAFSRIGAKAMGGNVLDGVYHGHVVDTVTGQTADTPQFTVRTTHTDTT